MGAKRLLDSGWLALVDRGESGEFTSGHHHYFAPATLTDISLKLSSEERLEPMPHGTSDLQICLQGGFLTAW